jgi:5-methylcytosine-specific restriction endonuclease McrA
MTPDNQVSNGGGVFICRTCKNDRSRARYARDLPASRAAGRERMRRHLGPLKGHAGRRKTECPQGHPYDDENTYVTPAGKRQCKACRRVRVMESWWRNRDKRTAENKAWREANQDRVRENIRRWRRENREHSNLMSRLKKQRRRAAGNLTHADWSLVLAVYGSACLSCGKDEATIDHVVPISLGGLNDIANVQPLCGSCNSSKGARWIDFRPVPLAVLLSGRWA